MTIMTDKRTTETAAVAVLYDSLTPYRSDGDRVWVVNARAGFQFLTVAVAGDGGDAGGGRMTTSEPQRIYPGLTRVPAAYWARVEGDAAAQRKRTKGGGVLSKLLDEGVVKLVKNIDKASASDVDGWLALSSDLQAIGDLRSHSTHGEAARKHYEAWHSNEASEQVKRNRHYWAMATDSRKVA